MGKREVVPRRGGKGNKYELDQRTAFSLYNKSETEIAHITEEFIRQISIMLAERGKVTIDRLGKFVIEVRKGTKGQLNIVHQHVDKNDNTVVAPQHILVHFSKSRILKARLEKAYKEEENMEKYGVDETTGHDSEQLEKMAAKGCPECGSELTKHGSVLICPSHGTKPFEASPSQGDSHGSEENT